MELKEMTTPVWSDLKTKWGSYHAYLGSREWRRRREERIFIDGGVCTICGSTKNLQCHHLSYEHIGTDEELNDIITLCEECHKRIHIRSVEDE